MSIKILIVCTGNSCRSQMAEGFLKSFGPELEVHSAGTNPAAGVNPNALAVMKESGIDISSQSSKLINKFLDQSFDYLITLCDNAKNVCPDFNGNVKEKLHIGFDDPYEKKGSREEVINEYRESRDKIRSCFLQLYNSKLKHSG